jgi:hypothetical protein
MFTVDWSRWRVTLFSVEEVIVNVALDLYNWIGIEYVTFKDERLQLKLCTVKQFESPLGTDIVKIFP